MIDRLKDSLRRLPQRLLSLWVKPAVLPTQPSTLINPEYPVLYVLEVGGVADRAALRLSCAKHGLPDPAGKMVFGTLVENSSVDVLKRRQGTIFRPHRQLLSERLSRIVAAGLEESAGVCCYPTFSIIRAMHYRISPLV